MLDSNQSPPLDELARVIANHHRQRHQGSVTTQKSYDSLRQDVSLVSDNSGDRNWSQIWEMVDLYLANSVNTAHPMYLNQLWAGQSEPALIGSMIESLANTSMYTYEVAPMATVVENEMCRHFKAHFGLQDWGSQVTTGGSNSNYLALLLALHRKFPDFKQAGLNANWQPRVYVSADAHYSFDKAVMMSGLGLNALVKVPVDVRGAMDVQILNTLISADSRDGHVPCLIVGTAGTTVRGAFDPFKALAHSAKSHGCWLHIDGAWGGALHYASESERYLSGCELADSFSWDAHKMLGVPLMCSLLFVRHQDLLRQAFALGDTSYIFHDSADSHDLGPYSLQCGRRVDMLKMWLEFLYYGEQGFRERIDGFLALAAHAEQRIHAEPGLELQSERWINNICFRSHPSSMTETVDLNAFNQAVRDKLKASGNALVNQAYLGDDLTIRLVLANKDLTVAHVDQFFDLWLAESDRLLKHW